MARGKIFYGWWVAVAFCVIVFLSTGLRFTVGPFLKPLVADLGLDRGSFSLVISLSLFLYGAFMPVVGRLVDRFGSWPARWPPRGGPRRSGSSTSFTGSSRPWASRPRATWSPRRSWCAGLSGGGAPSSACCRAPPWRG